MIHILYNDSTVNEFGSIKENAGLRQQSDVPDFLTKYGVKFSVGNISDVKDSHNANIYFVEPMRIPDENIFNNIPRETFDIIRQQKIKLVIYFPHEGFNLEMTNWLLKIHKLFDDYNLNEVPRFLIFGNLKTKDLYNDFINHYSIQHPFTEVFGIDYFQKGYQVDYVVGEYGNCIITPDYDKEKDFLNYNGAMRANRLLLVSELKRTNLEANGFVSFVGRYDTDTSGHLSYYKFRIKDKEQLGFLEYYSNSWKPQYIDATVDDLETNDRAFDLRHYYKSYFSLVSETIVEPGLFLTEKTFKPIAIGHPFMIYGCKGTLKYLRTQGYQTFPELFNEEYDDIDDQVERLNYIIEEVKKFCRYSYETKLKMYKSVLPKLEYNRNHFLNNQNQHSYVRNIMMSIARSD